jgi:hypothetical protein
MVKELIVEVPPVLCIVLFWCAFSFFASMDKVHMRGVVNDVQQKYLLSLITQALEIVDRTV